MSLTGKYRLKSFPSFPSSSLFFSLFLVPLPSRLLSILHRAQKGQFILSGEALIECRLCSDRGRQKNTPFLPFLLRLFPSPSRWSCARALCLGEVSASQSEVHFSLKHDVYLPGPVGRTVQVSVPFVRSDYDPCTADGLCKQNLWGT